MSGVTLALVLFGALLALIALAMPIGVAMLLVGGFGYIMLSGVGPLLHHLSSAPYAQAATYSLSVIPLFILMGQFATHAGLSAGLFNAANAWLGHRRGGIAMSAIGACAGFGAICGSSMATAATMAHVSLPEMRRFKYSGALASGVLAAGGTLGILIPPSVILVIYALLTEQSIGKLFIAAVVPGMLAAVGYMLAVAVYVRLYPEAGPAGPRAPFASRLRSLLEMGPVIGIFALVIGGIYAGWFTPTEGAAIGAAGTGILAVLHGGLRWGGFVECLKGTAKLTAMIFLILIGADLYNSFLALSQLPMTAARVIGDSGLPPMAVLAIILLFYLVMGCLMDSLSMILLTVPIFHPVIVGLDFGMSAEEVSLWFGILVLIVVEVGLITPPLGMNVFVINSFAPDIPITQAFRGVVPFLAADAVRVVLLVAFPSLTLGVLAWMGSLP